MRDGTGWADENNQSMKWLFAFFITASMLAAGWCISALVNFDIFWLLVLLTSLWAAIDSKKIGLHRYKVGVSAGPAVLFSLCYLLWVFVFPWYLWARFKIKAGEAVQKTEPDPTASPAKIFFRRFARIGDGVVRVVIVGLVAIKIAALFFCVEESWRGPRVWKHYTETLAARGRPLDWNVMIPPRVPDAQNFFKAPKMSLWFMKPSGPVTMTEDLTPRLTYTNETAPITVAELIVGPAAASSPGGVSFRYGNSQSGQQARQFMRSIAGPGLVGVRANDLLVTRVFDPNQIRPVRVFLAADTPLQARDIGTFFGGNPAGNPLSFEPAGTNSWHVRATFCRATDYLKWSDQFGNDYALMREAVKRPYARMDGDYSIAAKIPLENFVNFRAVSQTLAQRAQCYLLTGQPDKALRELTLLNDLRRVLESPPSGKPMCLVSTMINTAVAGLFVQVVTDGLQLHAWREPQLSVLEQELAQIDLLPLLKNSFWEEETATLNMFQAAMEPYLPQNVPGGMFWERLRKVRPSFMGGFFYFSMINVLNLDEMIVDSIDVSQNVVRPKKATEFQKAIAVLDKGHFWGLVPYKLLAGIAVPNFTKAMQTCALNQTRANEARVACALECFHLVSGSYPDTATELAPQFIDAVPHDIIGGQALKYRRTFDGNFLLYSVGWNETDDGGSYSSSLEAGDWIWR
jgi:hypothetical protein